MKLDLMQTLRHRAGLSGKRARKQGTGAGAGATAWEREREVCEEEGQRARCAVYIRCH